jgi:hypothetical protein
VLFSIATVMSFPIFPSLIAGYENCPIILIIIEPLTVLLFTSFAVTEKEGVALIKVADLPEITPVVELIENPCGKLVA